MIGLFFLMLMAIAGVLGLAAGLRYLGVVPRRDEDVPTGPGRADVHRLEEVLGTLDARLDRLEEQQRFLERLLEARPEPRSLPPAARGNAGADAEDDPPVDSVLFDVEPGDR